MLRTHKSLSLGLSALMIAGLAIAANADTISFDSVPHPFGPSPTDFFDVLSLTRFDPSLGTLTSVKIQLDTALNSTLTITNNGALASSGSAKTELQDAITDGAISHNTTNIIITGGNFNVQSDLLTPADAYSLAAGGSTTDGPFHQSGSDNQTFSSALIKSEFTGLSPILLNIGTFTQTVLANNGGNTSATQSTTASMGATVTYTYTPSTDTPEPGTWAMMIAGASTGLVALRRRRRNKK